MTEPREPAAAREYPLPRLARLVIGNWPPPPEPGRVAAAVAYGVTCHLVFLAAVVAMEIALFNGMTTTFGAVPWPWALVANALLLLQFPVLHSALLNGPGAGLLPKVLPGEAGKVMVTTTFSIFASLQLLALFLLWTPSGIVWWRAEGPAFWAIVVLHVGAWGFLMKSNFDAGVELQSGALGWMSFLQKKAPAYPDMPVTGLFRYIRQPIYMGFSLVMWTVPVWTPDQLILAAGLTAYCVTAPGKFKERRYLSRHGDRFAAYIRSVPYMLPFTGRARDD